jgi:hypothetical protein
VNSRELLDKANECDAVIQKDKITGLVLVMLFIIPLATCGVAILFDVFSELKNIPNVLVNISLGSFLIALPIGIINAIRLMPYQNKRDAYRKQAIKQWGSDEEEY